MSAPFTCLEQMREFLGTDELTLVAYLMTLGARSEVAETCQAYMAGKPGKPNMCLRL